jgi:glycosyltransferase involved in cell wall biosynthesis
MRLIFVNRFYWPETPATGQLLTDLAEAMAARGHGVIVVTSAATPTTPRSEVHRGVHIQRLAGTRWAHLSVLGKAVDFATFYAAAVWRVFRIADRTTIVVAMTDPPLLGIGAWLAARFRRAKLVHWVQDIYPEIATAVVGRRWLLVFRPLRSVAWRRADGCVVVGRDMSEALRHGGVAAARIQVIPNWAPAGVAPTPRNATSRLRAEWKVGPAFVVAYSGNLGRVHDLQAVLALAHALRNCPGIAFVLIGDGAQRAALMSEAARLQLPNVSFQPPQPRAALAETLAVADLHLVTLRPGCEKFVFPSKLYGVAAAGRPVLFIGPRECEVARTVTENNFGLSATRDEIETMASFVRRLAADDSAWTQHASAAARFAAGHDVSVATARWAEALDAVHACAPLDRSDNSRRNR